ncbi:MAG: hypothetical protein QOG60_2285 [Frankiaceae bacterium]|nr:hypothetical protein [Frankiaceae bacterium]
MLLRLDVADRVRQLPGQHYVVRLRAEDGYTASRCYSVASAPQDNWIELFIERLEDGEVSSFLADVVEPGDELEVRGPIGGWFVWTAGTPAIGVGGGTGVVPLVAMLRHAQALGRADLLELVVAARTISVLPYARELRDGGATTAFSRVGSPGGRPAGHLTVDDLTPLLDGGQTVFVCGSSGFAEAASQLLVEAGVATPSIRVERFGPSGVPSS